jgi:hypothetical protein
MGSRGIALSFEAISRFFRADQGVCQICGFRYVISAKELRYNIKAVIYFDKGKHVVRRGRKVMVLPT